MSVSFTRIQSSCRKVFLVRAVGEMLRFYGKRSTEIIHFAVFSCIFSLEEVATIKLHGRLVGNDAQLNA